MLKAIVNLTVISLLFAIVGSGIWIFANAEGTPAEAHPVAVEVTPELRSNIKSLTFASGYTCEEVTKAWWRYQDTERGKKLDYQCDGGQYLYVALMMPSGKVFISPR